MFLHRSNRAEELIGELARLVKEPAGGPLEAECIVVQGKGMERYLAMELARRHGVWANPDFPFARAVVDRAFAALLGPDLPASLDAESLRWAVARTLLAMHSHPGFELIAAYLEGDRHHHKLLQLSLRVARVLDGYGVYRPELLREWQERGGENWQARLWQALSAQHALPQIAEQEAAFVRALQAGSGGIAGLPSRISLFGVSAMPPLYLRVFAALAMRIEVHLFVLSPSKEYWADIRSQREILREALRRDGSQSIEAGNDLLASMGRLHRDFHQLLERDVNYVERSESYPEPAQPDTVLGHLQADILHLRQAGDAAGLRTLAADDRSLTVHSCHSPMRELEVLRDQIWARLHADPGLEPRDIIVMCPDIEAYAPFIDAVFAERRDGEHYLPFHIADRSPRTTHAAIDAFLRALDLIAGRLPGPAVLDLLAADNVRERFEIAASELATVREWIAESHIRWARDGQHRESVGQPNSDLNTWRFGLQRLLLGYASPASHLELFAGTLAYDDMEGSVADLLGRFAEFCENLFAVQEELAAPGTLLQWQVRLERALRALIVNSDETAAQHQLLRESFAKLAEEAGRHGFEEELGLPSIVTLLGEHLDEIGIRSNFLSGGIAFCQLVPMRSIPHRVICLAGMNDGEFPRNPQPLSFDLVASHPRLGDRSARDDDRYLFLEALLAARDALLISYTGQSNQTNQSLPPSVLVGELLDYLDAGFVSSDGASARKSLIVTHPLQSFSPRYFDGQDDKLFSYSRLYCEDARSLGQARADAQLAFISAPIPANDSEFQVVRLDQLLRFYASPAQFLVNQRVGIRLEDDEDLLQAREPLELDALEKYHVGEHLLRSLLSSGDDGPKARAALVAGGYLPLGTPAFMHLDSVMPVVQSIASKARAYQEGGPLASIEVDLHIGDTRLVGQLDSLFSQCRQEISFSRPQGKRELQAWIQHVVLCHQTPADYPRETICIGRDKKDGAAATKFRAVADSGPILRDLLLVYRLGQEQPVPLFLNSSRCFASHRQNLLRKDPEAGDEASLLAARAVYEGSQSSKGPPPERLERYIKLLFGDSDPLTSTLALADDEAGPAPLDFKDLAMKIFGPLLDHRGTA